jgi:thiosulfate dehydrogenase [quinone] large subunit
MVDDSPGMETPRQILETDMFGRQVRFEYSPNALGYALLGLRVVMGWILFQAGLEKLFDPTWTAAGYLQNAVPDGNPFATMFADMAGSAVVDQLVIWGLTLTGLGLLLGAAVRWCCFWAAIMMVFFWLSVWEGGIIQGIPLAHGWVVDDHVVYAVLLFGLGAFGAGRIVGVDAWLERTALVRKNRWLTYLLG